jgi:hypothetical protein
MIDVEAKNSTKLSHDITIHRVRNVNNFNNLEKNPVNGIVISGEGYEGGEEVLLDHNSAHPAQELFDHGFELPQHNKLYSIPIAEVYVYRKNKESAWLPCEGFLLVEKIFKPYKGFLEMPPTEIVDKLFVTEGEHKHKVVATDKYCFYTIIYQGDDGKETTISRMRDNEFELLAIEEELTEKVLADDLLIGEKPSKAIKFSEYIKE